MQVSEESVDFFRGLPAFLVDHHLLPTREFCHFCRLPVPGHHHHQHQLWLTDIRNFIPVLFDTIWYSCIFPYREIGFKSLFSSGSHRAWPRFLYCFRVCQVYSPKLIGANNFAQINRNKIYSRKLNRANNSAQINRDKIYSPKLIRANNFAQINLDKIYSPKLIKTNNFAQINRDQIHPN